LYPGAHTPKTFFPSSRISIGILSFVLTPAPNARSESSFADS
jgi:hypothetical protein